MSGPGSTALQDQVVRAFRNVRGLPAGDIVKAEYHHNVDAQDMATAFGGRHWRELSLDEVFFHRESVFMLSDAGCLSYLPAYLVRALTDDPEVGADITAYLISGLRGQRLELFDEEQRAAVAAVLRHLAMPDDDVGGNGR